MHHIADKFALVIIEHSNRNRSLQQRTNTHDIYWDYNGSIIAGLVFLGYTRVPEPEWDRAKATIETIRSCGYNFSLYVRHTVLTMRNFDATGNLDEGGYLIPLMGADLSSAASWEALEVYPLRLQKLLVHFTDWVRQTTDRIEDRIEEVDGE